MNFVQYKALRDAAAKANSLLPKMEEISARQNALENRLDSMFAVLEHLMTRRKGRPTIAEAQFLDSLMQAIRDGNSVEELIREQKNGTTD